MQTQHATPGYILAPASPSPLATAWGFWFVALSCACWRFCSSFKDTTRTAPTPPAPLLAPQRRARRPLRRPFLIVPFVYENLILLENFRNT